MPEFRFADHPRLAVVTCAHVLAGAPIRVVSRDGIDDWQFLCFGEHATRDARVVSAEHIVTRDDTLVQLEAMRVGSIARRASADVAWTFEADQ